MNEALTYKLNTPDDWVDIANWPLAKSSGLTRLNRFWSFEVRVYPSKLDSLYFTKHLQTLEVVFGSASKYRTPGLGLKGAIPQKKLK